MHKTDLEIDMSTLITDIAIRAPEFQDMEEFLSVMQKSKSLHKNWVPNAPYEQDAYLDFLKRFESDHTFGYLCSYNNQIFAAIIISQIVRDFLQSGYLGYYRSYISQQNKGIMSQAFKLVLK